VEGKYVIPQGGNS